MATQKDKKTRRALDDEHVGLVAEFANPGDLMQAATGVREAGYSRIDSFSPFPIHGMDKVMGLGSSKLGYIVMIGGLVGLGLGTLMQWWMNSFNYPIDISGMPTFALEQATPVTFEVTILVAGLAAIGGMLALNRLPRAYNPLFFSERFGRSTDDGFFLHVSAGDEQYDRGATAGLLRRLGALHVEYVDHTGAYDVTEDGALILTTPPEGDSPSTPPVA